MTQPGIRGGAGCNQGGDGSEYVYQWLGDKILAAELGENRAFSGTQIQTIEVFGNREGQPTHLGKGLPVLWVGVYALGQALASGVEVVTVAQIAFSGVLQ